MSPSSKYYLANLNNNKCIELMLSTSVIIWLIRLITRDESTGICLPLFIESKHSIPPRLIFLSNILLDSIPFLVP